LMVENGRLTGRIVDQEMVRRDIELAAEVQRRLLPQRLPESVAATFASFSLPARSIGGDYFDFLQPGDSSIGIAIADVAGKGIAAALIMSLVQASLRIMATGGDQPLSELTGRINRFLKQSSGSNRTSFATFFYAVLDEQSRRLRYVNAGHNPPLLARSGGAIEELQSGDRVIGMFAQAAYHEKAVDLQCGDVLLAFTDGVTEAMNANGEEFGIERLRGLLAKLASLPAPEIAARLQAELEGWTQTAPQHDDITVVVIRIR
jgi:sigma-B regulation protein RsbU (phosphoserine phosphatase)